MDEVCHQDLLETQVLQAKYFLNQNTARVSQLALRRYGVALHDQEPSDQKKALPVSSGWVFHAPILK